jgi:hypothetical protein
VPEMWEGIREWTFNSLSRDHAREAFIDWLLKSVTFNSLSRDHRRAFADYFDGVGRNFQLPLSGSLSSGRRH